jgi:hypothetical protein
MVSRKVEAPRDPDLRRDLMATTKFSARFTEDDSFERARGPIVHHVDGSKREIKPKQRLRMSNARIARNLEAWAL